MPVSDLEFSKNLRSYLVFILNIEREKMIFSYHFEFHLGKYEFSQCMQIIGIFSSSLIRYKQAEGKAHVQHIILKLEVQH